jgi:hypothetical protein
MKYLLCVFLAFATVKSYSQLSLNEMLAVYKMNLDQFESFAFKKGYKFSSVIDEECCFASCYVMGKGVNTKYITLYTKYFEVDRCVTTQTSIEKELLTLREQMINSGFKLTSTHNYKGSLVKTYKKDLWNIDVHSISTDEDSDYEISLTKER